MQGERPYQPQLFLVPMEPSVGLARPRTRVCSPTSRNMKINDLVDWSRQQLFLIASARQQAIGDDLFVYQQAAKLIEEVGELHAELLGRSHAQRAEKCEFTQQTLAEECADVAITMVMLAEALGVDLPAALTAKMLKVDERRSSQANRLNAR